MKIRVGKCQPKVTVGAIAPGDTIMFLSALAQKHDTSDLFIVLSICDNYIPKNSLGHWMYPGKVAVVNLRSGCLAYVERTRECIIVDAEVCCTGDK